MDIRIKTSLPSIVQSIDKTDTTKKKAPVSSSGPKPQSNYLSRKTQSIKSSNKQIQSFTSSVENEIRSQQAFSTYAQIIRITKLNRFKTRFDLFL